MARTEIGGAGQGGKPADPNAVTQTLSTSDQLFVSMFKRMEFCPEAALELVQTEQLNTRTKLERITEDCASKICKAIRSPGGDGSGAHVTEGAEHNLLIVAAIFMSATRVDRTIKCLDI